MEYEIGIRLDKIEYKIDLLLKAAGYIEDQPATEETKDTKQKNTPKEKTE